jgi:TrmH family RNA methyltransferase
MPILWRHDIRFGRAPLAVRTLDPQRLPLVEIVFEQIQSRERSVIDVEIDDAVHQIPVTGLHDAGKNGVHHAIVREARRRTLHCFELPPDNRLPNFGEHQRAIGKDVHAQNITIAGRNSNAREWRRPALTLGLAAADHKTMTEPLRITSRQNPRVKEVVQLRIGRERQRRGQFIIDGAREILRAIAAEIHCIEAYVCNELCDSPDSRKAIDLLHSAQVETFDVTPDVFAKLAFGDRHDGLVVVAETPRRRLSEVHLSLHPLVAVLESIEKPGNLGAILRSADAAGIDAVIVADARTDLYNPNTIRASLGTVFRKNVCEATSAATIDWLRTHGLSIVAARPDAETLYDDVDFRGGAAIVLGSEAEGLSDAWRGASIIAVRLPMLGMADSLNVSTTAAVLFYEALRQRGHDIAS